MTHDDRISSLEHEVKDIVKVLVRAEVSLSKQERDIEEMKCKIVEMEKSLRPLIEMEKQLTILVSGFKSASLLATMMKAGLALAVAIATISGFWKDIIGIFK